MKIANNIEMPRLLIIQRIVPEVRRDFFNQVLGRAEGFDIELLSSAQADREGHKLVSLGQDHSLVGIRYFKGLVHFQNSVCAVFRNDIIVVEHALNSLSNLLNVLFCALTRKSVVFWGHGGKSHLVEPRLKRICKAALLRFSNAYIGYTELSRRTLIEMGYDERKIYIINNSGVEKSRSHIDINESEFKAGRVKFAFCGRLTKQKKLDGVLRSFHTLARHKPEIELHLIGGGPEELPLKDQAARLSNVYFHGPMYGTERDKLMSTCHAQIIPNHVGLAILQGFALGLPLITSRDGNHCPEIEYYSDQFNGLSYDSGSDESLATAMAKLTDFECWRSLSEGATQTASRYPVSAMASLFLEALSAISTSKLESD